MMPTQPDGWADVSFVLDVIFKLALVLALIYGSLYLLRRWQVGAFASTRRQLTVLETTRLSARQFLHLVRVGEQAWLIGATDQAVSLLAEVELLPEVMQPDQSAPVPQAASAFAAALSRVLGRLRVRERSGEGSMQ